VTLNGARNAVEVGRPAAAGAEFVGGAVQWGRAAGAGVDARVRVVLVVFAGAGGFGAFLAEDAELFWGAWLVFYVVGL
jgi:hypothetical protein